MCERMHSWKELFLWAQKLALEFSGTRDKISSELTISTLAVPGSFFKFLLSFCETSFLLQYFSNQNQYHWNPQKFFQLRQDIFYTRSSSDLKPKKGFGFQWFSTGIISNMNVKNMSFRKTSVCKNLVLGRRSKTSVWIGSRPGLYLVCNLVRCKKLL